MHGNNGNNVHKYDAKIGEENAGRVKKERKFQITSAESELPKGR